MRLLLVILPLLISINSISQVNEQAWHDWNNSNLTIDERFSSLYQEGRRLIAVQADSGLVIADTLLSFAKKNKNQSYLAQAYGLKGLLYMRVGNTKSAKIASLENIKILTEIDDRQALSGAYINYASIEHRAGNIEKTIEYLKRGISLAKDSKAKRYEGNGQINLAMVLGDVGRYEEAITCFGEASQIFEQFEDSTTLMNLYNNKAGMYVQMGNYTGAQTAIDHGFHYQKGSQDLYGFSNLLGQRGNIHLHYEDFDSALFYFLKCKKLKEQIGDYGGAIGMYNSLSNVYNRQLNFEASDSLITKAAELTKRLGAMSYYTRFLSNLGSNKLKLGKPREAINILLQTTRLSDSLSLRESHQFSMQYLAISYMQLGMIDSADYYLDLVESACVKELKNVHGILNESELEQFIDNKMSPLFERYRVCEKNQFQLHEANIGAFNSSVYLKGLLLQSSTHLRNTILSSNDSQLIEDYKKWISLKEQIFDIKDETKSQILVDSAATIERLLVKQSSEFSNFLEVNSSNYESIRQNLGQKEIAIEFVHFITSKDRFKKLNNPYRYAAILVHPDHEVPQLVGLCMEPELENILGTFPGNNLSYIEQVYGTKENTKSQLYDLIWKPLEPHLEGIEKVYVSPVGLLHKISFAALAKEQDVYLCDNYEIEMMSSTGNLALAEPAKIDGNSSYTLFGGIDYNSDSTSKEIWSYLDGSLDETKKIEKTLSKAKRDVNYFNLGEATEAQFKQTASESNILHIATHGFFYHDPDEVLEAYVDETESEKDLVFRGGTSGMGVNTFVKSRNPLMRSGLVFAGANDVWNRSSIEGEDGVLTAAEVATIDMRNTELVVLSACETGLGDIKGSEGVYGLQRSFKMAGVKYLIMSLWQVPDKETAEFMTTFYENLTKSDDIKKAFKDTQMSMRKKYDPYFWAAFVLVE